MIDLLCDLCGKDYDSRGIEINKIHICSECEQKIITTGALDPDYPLWIERVKTIWDQVALMPSPHYE